MEYKDLEVWKESRKLVNSVYALTKEFLKEELYGLTSQIRRTAADTIPFLHISPGSLFELETQLYLSLDQEYLKEDDFKIILSQIYSCKKLINGFIKYYKGL